MIAVGAAAGIVIVKIRALFGKKTLKDEEEQVYDYMI